MSTATAIPAIAAAIAAAPRPIIPALEVMPVKDVKNPPTVSASEAADAIFFIADPIGANALATFFPPLISLDAPTPINPALSQLVRPAFSPPGRIADALENNFPIPCDSIDLPSDPAQLINGSAMILSQAISTFPKKSASFHSWELVMLLMLRLSDVAFPSTTSIMLFSASFTAGISAVIPLTAVLRYGESLSPKEFCTPSTALCIKVIEPARLSIIVSAMS